MRNAIRVAACTLLCVAVMPGVDKKVVFPAGAQIAGPYSPGIVAGGFLYVSGQGAKAPGGKFPDTVRDQVRQCLDNVKSIVEAAGLTMRQLVYAQVYVPEPWKFAEIDAAWKEYFGRNSPARAVLGVARLPEDTPVEINAIATLDTGTPKEIRLAPDESPTQPPDAVLSRGMLYFSGAMAANPKDALDRMGAALRAAGMDYRNVVFVNPYLTSAIRYGEMNRAYAPYFEFGNTPARATIEVSSLPDGATIEFTGVAIQDLSKRRAVRPKNMPPSATASPCVFAGDIFYCSAKNAFIPGPNSGVYASTVEEQVRMSFRNLLDGLEEAGLTLDNVVSANVYLDDVADFPKMNGVYKTYFQSAPPTRTTIQQIAPVKDRRAGDRGEFPPLEQISFIAVR